MDLLSMGMRIKAVRTEKKLTLERLSEKIGISRNFLWEIEAGRKAPAIHTLYNIGKELNISLDYIMGLSDNVKKIIPDTEGSDILKIQNILEHLSLPEIKTIYSLLKTYYESK